jgi:hypothetical protein
MCTVPGNYSQSDQAKSRNQGYDQMDERYRRWTQEDLQRTGQLGGIDSQVQASEQRFNQQKQSMVSAEQNRTPSLLSSMRLMQLNKQTFNADQMRQDLIREAALKRIESGVYNRPTGGADSVAPQQAVSVIGGGSGKSRGGTSGVASSTRPPATNSSPTGVKLNIGS